MLRLNLDCDHLMSSKVFSTEPFEKPGSKNLIKLVKKRDY